LLPTGLQALRTLVAFAALSAVQWSALAQVPEESSGGDDAPPAAYEPQALEELPSPEEVPAPEVTRAEQLPPEPVADEELPLPSAEPTTLLEPAAGAQGPGGIGNGDVQAMVAAEFSDSTIISVIGANLVQFDLSPRALVALKGAGVSERVIEAMIAAEAEKKRIPEPEPVAEPVDAQASVEYAKLTQMIEELAAKQEAAAAAQREPEPPASRADPSPRVWLVAEPAKTAIAPTIAQVAFAGGSRRGAERMKSLQGLAGQALSFVNPAVGGLATTLGSLFRPDEDHTAVWALAATSSTRVLDFNPLFEIDFAHIPGVDPDRYQPAIVQLVPTNDNYRLVAAAETDGANAASLPRGPIIEEVVATESTRMGRGQYRISPKSTLGPGEYALVLRPIPESRRQRRRSEEASLGELLGGSTSQILYLTWEFSIAAG
jgi:hypothetical protein